jgi:hypothetical protein
VLDELKRTIEAFKEILKMNLQAKEPSHSAIMLWLIRVFSVANGLLQHAATLEDKGKIFDLMKGMHPFLESNREVIKRKLKNEDIKNPQEIVVTMISFEKQTRLYSKFLRAANREKERKVVNQ